MFIYSGSWLILFHRCFIYRNIKSNCLGVFSKLLTQEKKKNSTSGKKVANKNVSSNSNFVDDGDDAALMQVKFINFDEFIFVCNLYIYEN